MKTTSVWDSDNPIRVSAPIAAEVLGVPEEILRRLVEVGLVTPCSLIGRYLYSREGILRCKFDPTWRPRALAFMGIQEDPSTEP